MGRKRQPQPSAAGIDNRRQSPPSARPAMDGDRRERRTQRAGCTRSRPALPARAGHAPAHKYLSRPVPASPRSRGNPSPANGHTPHSMFRRSFRSCSFLPTARTAFSSPPDAKQHRKHPLLMFSSYHTESRGTRRNQSPYLTKALAFFIQLRDNRGRREKCGSCRPSAQKQPGSPEQDVSSQKLCGTFAAAGQRRT